MPPEPDITAAQVRAIHVLAHRRGLEDDDYRHILYSRYSVASSKSLTRRQAADFIAALGGGPRPRARPATRHPIRNPHPPVPATDDDGVVTLATAKQRALIDALVGEVQWYRDNGYQAWLSKALGLERVRTRQDAHRVIRGLKGLKAKGHHRE